MRWLEAVDADSLYVSALVIDEIRRGITNLQRRDPVASGRLAAWLTGLQAAYADRILPITLPIAECWGRLSVPDPLPVVDGLLAATAFVHDLHLVTRNVRDVARTKVPLVNLFDEG